MLDFSVSGIMKFQQQNCILLSFLFITNNLVCSQTNNVPDCILDIQFHSSLIGSNCESHNWGGFINSCCESNFDDYLYALGLQANQTGKIFLNPSEQKTCLAEMEVYEKKNVTGCGIEKLTGGAGGCSDYTVMDVTNKLGDKLRRLDEDCMSLSKSGRLNKNCTACSGRWKEINETSGINMESADIGVNICRFAVLISLTSTRIDNRESIQGVYECLGTNSLSADTNKEEGRATGNSKLSSTDTNKEEGRATGNSKLSPGIWILSFGSAGVTIIILVAAWTFSRKRSKNHPTEQDATNSDSEHSTTPKITTNEINMATNNLSPSNFIGQGIAGKVYKGMLHNGQHVAIKHIMNEGYLETFVRELRSLSHVRHPNLVALLGYCEDEGECFLVYELCHKGSLSEWLFGKDKNLTWIQRLEIAVDSARGLLFLHTYPDGRIVHRDIKPSNILIDANFRAKLSDFGLSRVMDIGQSYVSSEVRGTFGYIDPEYRSNHRVNASGDVYSFGIVLLNLVSGQRVINSNFQKPMSLNKMARNLASSGDMSEFADPKLNGEYSLEAFDITLKLALSCIGLKQQRPSIGKVLYTLAKALNISLRVNSFTSSIV